MESIRILPIFLSGTLISSAACGMTSKPMKKNGLTAATLMMVLIMPCMPLPANICPSRLEGLPVTTDAAMSRMPAAPMARVRMFCSLAAVFAPMMLITVMNTAKTMAVASQVA